MSTITLELPDDIAVRLTTPEGMARAQATVMAAFADDEEAEATLATEKQYSIRTTSKVPDNVTRQNLEMYFDSSIRKHTEQSQA